MKSTTAALLASLLVALAVLPVAPSLAGTPEAPEITDPANDQANPDTAEGTCPAELVGTPGCLGARADVLAVWLDNETATTVNVNILLSTAPGTNPNTMVRWDFHATPAGGATDVVATINGPAQTVDETQAPPAVPLTSGAPEAGTNVLNVTVDTNTIIATVAKSIYGNSTTGLTNLHVVATQSVPVVEIPTTADTAPDAGPASTAAYNFTVGGGPGSPDSDSDGLLDAWEQEHFGNLAQSSSDDADSDGLTNGQEYGNGTDPTVADTDGDGFDDGAEIEAGSDPNDASSRPDDTTPQPTPTPTPTPSPEPSPQPTPTPTPTEDEPDKVKDNMAYLAVAGVGGVAILILAFVGFGRWGA